MKLCAPAAERNREPIAEVLAGALPARGLVLEVASGSGTHAVHLAGRFPGLEFQPSDVDERALASIAAARQEAALPNLRLPVQLDVTTEPWPVTAAAAVLCINMIHIAPWPAALGLLRGAARVLAAGGGDLLYLYGPYCFDGQFTAPSNQAFDASLRARDPGWGVRDVRDLQAAAAPHRLELAEVVAMPANNHSLLFRLR
jgi:SAM-dependent methyltransferase